MNTDEHRRQDYVHPCLSVFICGYGVEPAAPWSAVLLSALFEIGQPRRVDAEVFNLNRAVAFGAHPRGGEQTALYIAVLFDPKLDVGEWIIHRPRAAPQLCSCNLPALSVITFDNEPRRRPVFSNNQASDFDFPALLRQHRARSPHIEANNND